MVYNGTTLSLRSTVHGLHLQDDQVGDIHLTLRMRGGGKSGNQDRGVSAIPKAQSTKRRIRGQLSQAHYKIIEAVR